MAISKTYSHIKYMYNQQLSVFSPYDIKDQIL